VTRLSIETSFAWAQRFVAREWGLLLPIALAFIGFPPLVLGLLVPGDLLQAMMIVPIKDVARVQAALVWLVPSMLAILAVGGVGGLAITALALTPRMSVGEAIGHALRRLPVLAASTALLFVGLLFFAVVVLTLLFLTGLDPVRTQAIAISLLLVAALAMGVRMSPLPAVIAQRRIGPIDAIGEAWKLGRGAGWKMFLALLVYYVGVIVVIVALGSAIGACVLAAARLGGWPAIAPPLLAVVDRALGGVGGAGAYVVAASFYRQLSGANKGI